LGLNAASGQTVGNTDGHCPASVNTGSPFWAQQNLWNGTPAPDYASTGANNWMLYAQSVGLGIGDVHAQAMGATASSYYLYLNLGSPTLIDLVSNEIKYCQDPTGHVDMNAYQGGMSDNMPAGLISAGAAPWGTASATGGGGLRTGKNFGTGSIGSSYADPTFGSSGNTFVPSAFFNGATHTRASLISSNNYPLNFTTDTSYETTVALYFQSFFHRDGTTPWWFVFNGLDNTDTTYLKQTHVFGGMAEEYDVGCFGCGTNSATVGPTSAQSNGSACGLQCGADTIINSETVTVNDVLQPNTNPNAHFLVLASSGDTGEWAAAGSNYQQDQRWHYGLIYAGANDSFPTAVVDAPVECTVSGCVNSFGPDFAMPAGRITPWASDPAPAPCGENGSGIHTGTTCVSGGSHDPNLRCDGTTPGFFCFEFHHYWVEQVTGSAPCTQFSRANWPTCVHDIGPLAMIINASSGNVTLSPTNLALWWPNTWSSVSSGHVVALCQEAAGYYAWANGGSTYTYLYSSGTTATTVCQGTTGADFATGGAPASGDAVWHTTPISTIENTVLTPGQVLLVTAQ
jgi:hypothetical protein